MKTLDRIESEYKTDLETAFRNGLCPIGEREGRYFGVMSSAVRMEYEAELQKYILSTRLEHG